MVNELAPSVIFKICILQRSPKILNFVFYCHLAKYFVMEEYFVLLLCLMMPYLGDITNRQKPPEAEKKTVTSASKRATSAKKQRPTMAMKLEMLKDLDSGVRN
jgi:hypothetical protein